MALWMGHKEGLMCTYPAFSTLLPRRYHEATLGFLRIWSALAEIKLGWVIERA